MAWGPVAGVGGRLLNPPAMHWWSAWEADPLRSRDHPMELMEYQHIPTILYHITLIIIAINDIFKYIYNEI